MNFKNKRVFISGGAGVIGTYLVEQLLSEQAIIFVGDLKPCPLEWRNKVLYRQGDLNYITKAEIEKFNPEYFFHLAATFERTSETYDFWDDNFHNNIQLSHHLMNIFRQMTSLKKVIFASSYLIYDPDLYLDKVPQTQTINLDENSPIRPRNLVGMAKLLFESELEFLINFKLTNFSVISARIYRSYGKNSRDIISRWIRMLLKNETIGVYGQEGIFDYVYAGDVADGLIRLAKTYKGNGVVNLGSGKSRRISDIILILKKHFPNLKYKNIKSEIDKIEASQAELSKLYKITNWKPTTTLEKAISEIVKFEKNNIDETDLYQPKSNVLLTSLSEKVPMITTVKTALHKLQGFEGAVIGADSDKYCSGRYFVDDFWKMPNLQNLKVEDLIKYCTKKNIRYIIPSRDGELAYFAKYKNIFHKNGIYVMVSDTKTIRICLDKFLFYKFGKENNIPVIETETKMENINNTRIVVKERFGSGSKGIGLNLTHDEASARALKMKNPIFQPFISGREASVDVYVNKFGKLVGTVTRWRDTVIDGESKITSTFYNEKVNQVVSEFLKKIKLFGHAVIQIFIDKNNNIKIIECNPRFGGASTLSLAAGLDSFFWFMLESMGQEVPADSRLLTTKNLRQIRFKSDFITSKW